MYLWPEGVRRNLWPYALKYVCDIRNKFRCYQDSTPEQLFLESIPLLLHTFSSCSLLDVLCMFLMIACRGKVKLLVGNQDRALPFI
jgi:hypothetical protein